MSFRIFIVGLLLVLFVNSKVSARESDSLKITGTNSFGLDYSALDSFQLIDTVLNQFYQYEKDGRNGLSSLGNPGLSYSSMLFKGVKYGFNSGEEAWLLNFESDGNNKIYNTNIPIARVSYEDGPKKYQNFDVLFSESINPRLNFTIGFNTQSSTGFYLNQETITKRFDFQTSYRNRKESYGFFFKFKVRNVTAHENGGIKSDSVYNELTLLSPLDINNNKLKVQVWNEEAVNNYDYRNVYLNQFVTIFSALNTKGNKFRLLAGLENNGGYNDIWYEDFIVDSSYYSSYFELDVADSSMVFDQSKLFYLKNNGFLKLENIYSDFDLILGTGFNIFENKNVQKFDAFTSSDLFVRLPDWKLGRGTLNFELHKGVAGFNSEGFDGHGDFAYPVVDSILKVRVGAYYIKNLPNYKFLNYGGNVFHWSNEFSYSNSGGVTGDLIFKKFDLSIHGEYERNSNYVYYGRNTRPIQHEAEFSRYMFEIKKGVVLGNYHFDFSVLHQSVEENAPVNLANWIGVVSVYYQRMLFKDAMELRYGIDYWQFSKYNASAYSPFTRSFVYQDNVDVGDFPYLNFYVSARIKGAQGFVNFQNIGQFVFRENYMMIPTYALQDFGVSFGLRWDFYN